MTPLVKAIAALPHKQVVLMVKILINHQITELVDSLKDGVTNQEEEVEKFRTLEVVQVLPDEDKEEVSVMCDNALKIIKKMSLK